MYCVSSFFCPLHVYLESVLLLRSDDLELSVSVAVFWGFVFNKRLYLHHCVYGAEASLLLNVKVFHLSVSQSYRRQLEATVCGYTAHCKVKNSELKALIW